LGEQAQNHFHRETHAADDRFTAENCGIAGNPVTLCHLSLFAVRADILVIADGGMQANCNDLGKDVVQIGPLLSP
jgi:hypothetical protein